VTDDCSTDFIASFIPITNCRPCNCSISCQAPHQWNEENTCSLSWLEGRHQGSQMLVWRWCEYMHLVRAPKDRRYGTDGRREAWETKNFKCWWWSSRFLPFLCVLCYKTDSPFVLESVPKQYSRSQHCWIWEKWKRNSEFIATFSLTSTGGLFLLQSLLSAAGLCSLYTSFHYAGHLMFVISTNGK